MNPLTVWQPSTTTARGGLRTWSGVLAVGAALTLSACGGSASTNPSAETSDERDGSGSEAAKTAPAQKPANPALFQFAASVRACGNPSDELSSESNDEQGVGKLVINNPQFSGPDSQLGALAKIAFHSPEGNQDAWVMPDLATAERAGDLLAPFRDADPANKTVRADTTVVAFSGENSGVVQQCVVQARGEMTRQGIRLADAGQPAESNVKQLTAADRKAALKVDRIGEYCLDVDLGPDMGPPRAFANRAAVEQALRRFVPLVNSFPSSVADPANGGLSVEQTAADLLAVLDEYPSCLPPANKAALKKAIDGN